ncbi:MAG: DUF116 domain-containing protein [Planctomycetota bacterium]
METDRIASPTTGAGVPATRALRETLREHVRARVAGQGLCGQMSQGELAAAADAIITTADCEHDLREWLMVLINTESWRTTMAGIPIDQRLLLLPQCLRHAESCPAAFDALGLLCQDCGRCELGRIKREAEERGYMVLISEGTSAVLALVQSGKIKGFIGSACLANLKQVFPIMSLIALPAMAVPLLCDGCRNTSLDLDWLEDYLAIPTAD